MQGPGAHSHRQPLLSPRMASHLSHATRLEERAESAGRGTERVPGGEAPRSTGLPVARGRSGTAEEEAPMLDRPAARTPRLCVKTAPRPGRQSSRGREAGGRAAGGRQDRPWGSEGGSEAADLTVLDKEQFFEELKRLYRKKVLPLELASKYAQFHSAPLNPADFEAKPMVLLLGQYSVGKTSFIRSLLQGDFPGQRVGPEPTTDRFMAVMHGPEPRLVPGHALAMQADKPFRGVASFGNNFLTKFEAAEVPAPILRNITLIDSPGILSGEKQRLGRDYDYQAVIQWFADRADLIIIMFDAHKLDISDELRIVMDALRIHQDKIRILLNKADQIDSQQLMRIYGALMWSLGKVVNTPEVCRVYIGSFWEHPLKHSQNRFLLEKEKADLLAELDGLPQNAVVRRINELVKRARSVKVHAYLIHYLRKQVPTVFGKSEKQAKLLQTLPREFVACARRYGLPLGDFPDINKFRARLGEVKDLRKFPKLDKAMVQEMDRVFSHDIPKLVEKASRQPQYGGREAGGDYYARDWRR
ncbi:hypothetical protein NSK_002422 [Nannochloropsis salina CCMP1776]|uniref:Dynamin-type G domain-containing protein n=1 Tax=Nannochloropsis salina CCMP1776 TaxID=1027361 RepID=A0A4D9D5E5_9STRA|nr:hypothetical protein NSK_002422 [Nannochloropsis salina CCMP1776]|eukprot:TFJ86214.1 hypothetical protein NSK_002422 [Nannochloropsis salina CCMP1776]